MTTKREDVLEEIRQVEKDLVAFSNARGAIQHRVQEMEGTPRQELFSSWAMTQLLMNAFVLATVRCEGLIQDYKKALDDLDAPDNVIHLVKGDQHGSTSGK